LAHEIGRVVGKLHSEHIIHGDLTTSNMLLKNYEQLDLDNLDKHLYFIDFGLSHISSQLEDKGVDLYVLERALLSTHSVQAKDLMDNILLGYQKEHKENYEDVLNKLNQVRLRGRKRSMIG
jgi:TP53 regulating kinase-like protein